MLASRPSLTAQPSVIVRISIGIAELIQNYRRTTYVLLWACDLAKITSRCSTPSEIDIPPRQ